MIMHLPTSGRRLARLVLTAAPLLTLAACDYERLLFDPAAGAGAALAVSFSESPIAAAQNALNPADRVRIRLARAEAAVVDTTFLFPVSQTEMRAQVEVPIRGDSESLTLTVELQEGERVLSRGVSDVTLRSGEANAAEVVTDPVFAGVTVADQHACHLTASGAAYCWGMNGSGQLGSGDEIGSSTPVPVRGGLRFVSLDATGGGTCGLTAEGKAFCWGPNSVGQVGDGSTTDRSTPTAVAGGLSFVALSRGNAFACGLAVGGEAYCWGSNRSGALGTGTTDSGATTPQKVAGGLAFAALSSTLFHTCALTREGKAYCWGNNSYGQLGDGSNTTRNVPVEVSGSLTFSSIASGSFHTCGITTEKDVYCWGARHYNWGQLGNGSQTESNVPVPVQGGLRFVSLTAGQGNNVSEGQTCGLTADGVAYCWGNNEHGQLGTTTSETCTRGSATKPCAMLPVPVGGGIVFQGISASNQATCGVSRGGDTYCWGHGEYGQLASGALRNVGTPTKVLPSTGPVSVASVALTPGRVTLKAAGDTVWLNGTAKDQNGRPIPASFQWSSSDSTIASVRWVVVTARAAGSATVRGELGGKSASTSITVGSSLNNYSLRSLGALNGVPTLPWAIDRWSRVAGGTDDDVGTMARGWWWNGQTLVDVGTLGGSGATVIEMNDYNVLVGESSLPGDSVSHAFVWSGSGTGGTMVDLGSLAPPSTLTTGSSEAYGINNGSTVFARTAVGWSDDAAGASRAVMWNVETRAITELGFNGWGTDVNERGVIVGSRLVGPDEVEAPVVWENGVARALPALSAYESEAIRLNNLGEIVGFSSINMDVAHPVLWRNGQLIDLTQTGDLEGEALDVNEHSQVVGYVDRVTTTDTLPHAFIWNKGDRRLLNDAVSDKSWHIGYATGINDNGVIAAYGCQGTTCGAVILTPVRSPAVASSVSYLVTPSGARVSRQALRELREISLQRGASSPRRDGTRRPALGRDR